MGIGESNVSKNTWVWKYNSITQLNLPNRNQIPDPGLREVCSNSLLGRPSLASNRERGSIPSVHYSIIYLHKVYSITTVSCSRTGESKDSIIKHTKESKLNVRLLAVMRFFHIRVGQNFDSNFLEGEKEKIKPNKSHILKMIWPPNEHTELKRRTTLCHKCLT